MGAFVFQHDRRLSDCGGDVNQNVIHDRDDYVVYVDARDCDRLL